MKTRRWLSEYEHFREQGITIMSILTAIGMAISTLMLALTGGGSTPDVPSLAPRPPDKGRVEEWVKKHLQALGRALANLAGRAAAALPGIIGFIVSWVLSMLGKTATWLAENLWTLVIGVGTLLLVVSYCGQSMSVVRRASSVVRRASCSVNNCFKSLLLLHPWAN